MLVYVASPLGFTLPTKAWYDGTLLPSLTGAGHTVLDPWSASVDVFMAVTDEASLAAASRSAGATNEQLIRSCDAVFAVLDGVDVDSGTAAEIGFAAALGKLVIGWRSDQRLAGENAATTVNLQVEHFLSAPVFRDLDDAISRLR